jgi:hypothetical protein
VGGPGEHHLKLARLRKTKPAFFSYMKYRPNTNISNTMRKQVMLRRGHIGEGEGKRRKLRR